MEKKFSRLVQEESQNPQYLQVFNGEAYGGKQEDFYRRPMRLSVRGRYVIVPGEVLAP